MSLDAAAPTSADAIAPRRTIVRAAGALGLGNIASRVLGLVRETVIFSQFGAGPLTSAFIVASQVPTTIYDLLIGGLLSSALVPVFSEYATRDDENRSLWSLAGVILSIVSILLVLFTVLVFIFAPQVTFLFVSQWPAELQGVTATMLRFIAPSILFFGLSGVLTGLLFALKRFTFAAFATSLFNLGIIVGALVISRFFEGDARIFGLVLGLFLGSVLQLSLLLPDLRDVPFRFHIGRFWRDPGIRRIVALYIPVALSFVVSNIGIIFDRNLASGTTTAEETISWMRAATTLIQFPIGLVAVAISLAVLPNLSRLSALGEQAGYRRVLQRGLRLVLVLIVPATIGLFILGQPIVSLLFEHGAYTPYDTYWTTWALRLYLLGLPFAAIDQVLIIAFYSRQDTWTPALVGIATVVIFLVVALLLVGPFQMLGLVFANSVQHFAHALIMVVLLQRRMGGLTGGGLRAAAPRILLAATGMGLVVWLVASATSGLQPGFVGRVLAVLLPGAAGLASYALFTTLLRLEEAREVAHMLLRR
jgi:putative peptidoglycan lipid II flippase